jgi:hypothetical protein
MEQSIQELYIVLPNRQTEWEDIRIFLDKDAAIVQCKDMDDWRVEVFKPNSNGAFVPTYETVYNPRQ